MSKYSQPLSTASTFRGLKLHSSASLNSPRLLFRPALDDACRILDFGPLLSGKRFKQHVIMRDRVLSEDMCQARCFMDTRCFSINFNQTGDATDGKHVCELNDMSAEEGQDLAAERDFSYRGAKVGTDFLCDFAPEPAPAYPARALGCGALAEN